MAYLDEEDSEEDGAELAQAPSGALSADGKAALRGALAGQEITGKKLGNTYEELTRRQEAKVAQQRQIIDTTIEKLLAARSPQGVVPLLSAAAGFLSPTRTGGTGESIGNALRGLTPALEAEDRERRGNAIQIGQLESQGAALEADLLNRQRSDVLKQILGGQRTSATLANALARAEKSAMPSGEFQQIIAALGIKPGDPRYEKLAGAYLQKKLQPQQGRLYQIPDEKSPTGFRYATSDQAVGQGAMGPSGVALDFGPDGKATGVRVGAGVGAKSTPSGLTPTTATRVEKELIDFSGQLAQLDTIEQKFDPKFHQYGEQFRNWGRGKAEKLGVKLSEGDAKALSDYAGYVRDTGIVMANIRHELFGATLTKGEQTSAEKFILSEDDSPTQAQAKLKGFSDMARKSVGRLAYIRQHGLKMEDIPLEKVPQIMRARGNQIERDLIEQGLEGEQLKSAVRVKLMREFGLGT